MSSKRSHAESEGIHESRHSQVYENEKENNFKPSKKPRRDGPPKIRKQMHASSVNAVKKRIRDVTRLLSRSEDLPADVRLDNERALAAYQQELAAADEEKIRQKMIKKYHMVRFFGKLGVGIGRHSSLTSSAEKQKATRMLKKLKKQLLEATTTEEVEDIKTKMHVVEVDLNYTHYYPLNERYVSLYPQKGAEEEENTKEKEAVKPPVWAEIEKRMEDGTLKELRYGVREGHAERPKSQKPKPSATKPRLASENQTFKKQTERTEQPRQKERVPEQPDYGLNRRERRKAMLKSGAIKPAKAAVKETVHEPIGNDEGNDGNISDGGFFEE